MPLAQHLIDKELQFDNQRKHFLKFAGCAADIDFKLFSNHLIVIATTQRTGSTLMCQDISSAFDLSYCPTESFLGVLTGFFNGKIAPEAVSGQLMGILQLYKNQKISVYKVMIDYLGWLGFLCTTRQSVGS